MASSEIRGNDSQGAAGTEDRSGRRSHRSRVLGAAERDKLLKESREIQFPIGLRGYERAAVDRYVERVTRIIAELEMSSSPESAVKHALDEVSEETRDILQHAHQTAEEIAARSRAKADERLQQAEREAREILAAAQREAQETREAAQREAHELREMTGHELTEMREASLREAQQVRAAAQRESDEVLGSARREAAEVVERAETRAREFARSAEAIWHERRRLIDDMRSVGEQLVAIGEVEGKRFATAAEELQSHDEPVREPTPAGADGPPQAAR